MFEKVSKLQKTESVKIGSMECDVYQNTFGFLNFTNQQTIVDSSDCSIVSIVFENSLFFPGNGIWSLSNYIPKPMKLQVPNACFENPKSIKNLSFSGRFI
ncbi:hypothetical protein ACTFIY_009354 [Dictyostelium cf. discoideum]